MMPDLPPRIEIEDALIQPYPQTALNVATRLVRLATSCGV